MENFEKSPEGNHGIVTGTGRPYYGLLTGTSQRPVLSFCKALVTRAKRGRAVVGEREKRVISLPCALPPNPLPVSTPATQATINKWKT